MSSTRPKLSLIVARAKNGVIGMDGDMPWQLSEDLKRFKKLTQGKPIIMGRNTWESLPRKPLPKRTNIVLSRQHDFHADGAMTATNITLALAMAEAVCVKTGENEIHIIGGAHLYKAALPYADKLYITEVHAEPEGDTWFPEIEADKWRTTEHVDVGQDDKNNYPTTFKVMERAA